MSDEYFTGADYATYVLEAVNNNQSKQEFSASTFLQCRIIAVKDIEMVTGYHSPTDRQTNSDKL
jgi:hypothetical protein